MERKKTVQETTILALMTVAAIAGISFFVAKLWLPEKFTKKTEEVSVYEEEPKEEKSMAPQITVEELKSKIDSSDDIILLDVQGTENYIQASIPNSISIPLAELDQRMDELPKNKEIIVIDAGQNCEECQRAAEMLVDSGFVDVKSLIGGITAWADAGYPVSSGKETTFQNINARGLMDRIEANEDIIIIDVRDKDEYDKGHIQGAIYLPFEGATQNLQDFPKTKEIIIYDKLGNRSKTAVQQFIKNGYTNVINLLDGVDKWVKEGYPMVGEKEK
jgi:rhodanese-related sulfurtransferase